MLAIISFTLAALIVAVLNIKYQVSNTKISNAQAGSLSLFIMFANDFEISF